MINAKTARELSKEAVETKKQEKHLNKHLDDIMDRIELNAGAGRINIIFEDIAPSDKDIKDLENSGFRVETQMGRQWKKWIISW